MLIIFDSKNYSKTLTYANFVPSAEPMTRSMAARSVTSTENEISARKTNSEVSVYEARTFERKNATNSGSCATLIMRNDVFERSLKAANDDGRMYFLLQIRRRNYQHFASCDFFCCCFVRQQEMTKTNSIE